MIWDWNKFVGDPVALKWNRKDLSSIDNVLRYVSRRSVAVQAGGNLGIFPKYLSCKFRDVYTFEPDPQLFVQMTINAPESNVHRFQAALGVDHEMVDVSRVRRDGKPDAHAGITHVSGTGPIPTIRLDDLHLRPCDLIYLDVEGFEKFALAGAEETIARYRPVIACEINKSTKFVGLTKDDVRGFIVAQGYRMVERIKSDEVFIPC